MVKGTRRLTISCPDLPDGSGGFVDIEPDTSLEEVRSRIMEDLDDDQRPECFYFEFAGTRVSQKQESRKRPYDGGSVTLRVKQARTGHHASPSQPVTPQTPLTTPAPTTEPPVAASFAKPRMPSDTLGARVAANLAHLQKELTPAATESSGKNVLDGQDAMDTNIDGVQKVLFNVDATKAVATHPAPMPNAPNAPNAPATVAPTVALATSADTREVAATDAGGAITAAVPGMQPSNVMPDTPGTLTQPSLGTAAHPPALATDATESHSAADGNANTTTPAESAASAVDSAATTATTIDATAAATETVVAPATTISTTATPTPPQADQGHDHVGLTEAAAAVTALVSPKHPETRTTPQADAVDVILGSVVKRSVFYNHVDNIAHPAAIEDEPDESAAVNVEPPSLPAQDSTKEDSAPPAPESPRAAAHPSPKERTATPKATAKSPSHGKQANQPIELLSSDEDEDEDGMDDDVQMHDPDEAQVGAP